MWKIINDTHSIENVRRKKTAMEFLIMQQKYENREIRGGGNFRVMEKYFRKVLHQTHLEKKKFQKTIPFPSTLIFTNSSRNKFKY